MKNNSIEWLTKPWQLESDSDEQYRCDLGKRFRSLSEEEQRRYAEVMVSRAKKPLMFEIRGNSPPQIEYHRTNEDLYGVTFTDREVAMAWVTWAYRLGYAVTRSYSGSSPGHPCDGVI
jgi:hypothetical protein